MIHGQTRIILHVSNKKHVQIEYKVIKEQINILTQGLREKCHCSLIRQIQDLLRT